ncbi:MAG: S8 family serine peptidase [Clostridia bacterium]|nr:S8 family serine peptidase [Clostridia bacterium]
MKRRKLFSMILSLLLLVGVMSPGAEAVAGRAKAQPEDGLSLMSFASLVYDMQKTYDGELEPDRVVTYEELNGSHSIGSVNAAVGTVDRAALSAFEDEGYTVTEGREGVVLSRPYQTRRLIVKGEVTDDHGAIARVSGYHGLTLLQYATENAARAAEEALETQPGVVYVAPDRVVSTCEAAQTTSHLSWGYGESYVGIDSFLGYLGDLPLHDVTVAVIDTGVLLTHPFLASRVLTDDDYDFANNDDDATDDHYHGTHVAGTVVDGTPDTVKILPVKVLTQSGFGTDSTVFLGIRYAIEQGADVMNLSLGGEGVNPIYEEAINDATAAGVVVCVAAGNNQRDAGSFSPANVASAITVGATDNQNKRASFSNFGDAVDIAAPGVGILSAVPASAADGQDYKQLNGTSMASPHVAAVAACLKSLYPGYTCDAVLRILQAAAKPLSTPRYIGNLLCASNIPATGLTELALGETELEMYPGQTYLLTAASAAAVTFTSSAPGVVSVAADGTLTAHTSGTAVITAAAGGFTDTCEVRVSPVTVTALYPEVDAYLGVRLLIPHRVSHGFTVSYSSDNETVARVGTDGVLEPIALGTATITLKAAEGTPNEATAEVHVTVREIGDWYSPDATDLTITNARELYEFSIVSNYYLESFEGKTITIPEGTPAIDLSGYSWIPIGLALADPGRIFRGSFNANRVPIVGLTTRYEELYHGDGRYYGLFASAYRSEIRGVRLVDADISGMSVISGICALAQETVIDDCRVSGTVECRLNDVGGIAASAYTCTVSNCVNAAHVTGSGVFAGGIAALSVYGSQFINCVNLGDVDSVVSAGLVCLISNWDVDMVTYTAEAADDDGGDGDGEDEPEQEHPLDIDNISAMINCVSYGRARYSMAHTSGYTLYENCWDRTGAYSLRFASQAIQGDAPQKANNPEVTNFDDALLTAEGELLTDKLNAYAFRYNGLKGDVCYLWGVENDMPIPLEGVFESDDFFLWFETEAVGAIVGESLSLPLNMNGNADVTWTSSDPTVATVGPDGVLTALNEGDTVVTAAAGGKTAELTVHVLAAGAWYSKTGSPLRIRTPEELHELARLVNRGIDDFAGRTVLLENDIDISGFSTWEPISASTAPQFFRGVFDGQNHTVSGLTATDYSNANQSVFGLFGVLAGGGVIQNTVLDNVNLSLNSDYEAAALCARLLVGGTVQDCEIAGGTLRQLSRSGSSQKYYAGVVARSDGKVLRCVNRMAIDSKYACAAGVVGGNTGVVNLCVNYGTIEGVWYLAGVCVGNRNEDGVIANCINYGRVAEKPSYVYSSTMVVSLAGVVTSCEGRVYNCLNAGEITAGGSGSVNACASGIAAVNSFHNANTFALYRCVSYGSVSATQTACAIGRFRQATCQDVFWLDTSCSQGIITEGYCQLSSVSSFDTTLTTSSGWTVLEYLNGIYLKNFNKFYSVPDAPALSWTTDENGMPAFGEPCAHPSSETYTVRGATCNNEGRKVQICSVCGARLGPEEIIPIKEHSLYENNRFEPTCVDDGSYDIRCRYCSYYRHVILPATGEHEFETRTVQEPSCTATGLEGDFCKYCDQRFTELRTVPKTAHRYVVTDHNDPTCTTNGWTVRTCETCGDTDMTFTEPLGHADNNGDGYCDRCSADLRGPDRCKLCGEVHTGFFGAIIGFFHRIIYFFQHLFG